MEENTEQDTKKTLNPQEVISSVVEKGYYEYTFTILGKPCVLRTLSSDQIIASESGDFSKENGQALSRIISRNYLAYSLQQFGNQKFTKFEDALKWLGGQLGDLVEAIRLRHTALSDEVKKIVTNNNDLSSFF